MINFKDRIPTKPNRYEVVSNGDGTSTITRADEPLSDGTLLNRNIMMEIQGFNASNTVFNPDGSITETSASGNVLNIVFNPDGTIDETLTDINNDVTTLRTTFNPDGSISREVI